MRRIKLRPGVTFIEIMIVVVIASLLIMLVVQWQTRLTGSFVAGASDMALQTDQRVLFDYFSTDLTSAMLVATGKGDKLEDFDWKPTGAGQTLQVIKLKKDPKLRHVDKGDPKKPAYGGYPYFTDDGSPTVQKFPALRVLYETDAEPNPQDGKTQLRVWRTEEEGTLERKEEAPKCERDQGWAYSFTGAKAITRKELKANRVTSFAIIPLGFMPKPAPPGGQPGQAQPDAATPPGGLPPPERFLTVWAKSKPCAQLHHITALGVKYTAEDVKVSSKGSEGKVELISKFYMEERSAAYRFDAAFSSVDEVLF